MRSFILKDLPKKDLHICAFFQEDDVITEKLWASFFDSDIGKEVQNLFSKISYEAYQDALRGSSQRLYRELGLPPSICLLKLSSSLKNCAFRSTCASFKTHCYVDKPKCPMCFESDSGLDDVSQQELLMKVLEFWRQGYYVIITPMEP